MKINILIHLCTNIFKTINYKMVSILNNFLFRFKKKIFKINKNHYYSIFDKKTVKFYNYAKRFRKTSFDGVDLDIYLVKDIEAYSYLGLIINKEGNPVNIYDEKTYKKKKLLRYFMPYKLNIRSKKILGNTLLFCNPGRNLFNYFHFVIDLGMQLFLFKKKNIKLHNLILFSNKNINRENFVKFFYPKIKFIYCNNNEIIKIKNLFFSKNFYLSKFLGKKLSKLFLEYKNFINSKIKLKVNFTTNRTIFINRYESRRLVNLKYFKKKLEFREIFFSSNQSFKQQKSSIKNSSKIIGLHGAGMTNIIFVNKNTPIIELIPSYYPSSCYEDLCKSFNLKYKKITINKNLISQKNIHEIKNFN